MQYPDAVETVTQRTKAAKPSHSAAVWFGICFTDRLGCGWGRRGRGGEGWRKGQEHPGLTHLAGPEGATLVGRPQREEVAGEDVKSSRARFRLAAAILDGSKLVESAGSGAGCGSQGGQRGVCVRVCCSAGRRQVEEEAVEVDERPGNRVGRAGSGQGVVRGLCVTG